MWVGSAIKVLVPAVSVVTLALSLLITARHYSVKKLRLDYALSTNEAYNKSLQSLMAQMKE